MNNFSIYLLLMMTAMLHMSLAQLTHVPIKSHRVLTDQINTNDVGLIYDNRQDTIGSFYSASKKILEVEFDLGKNYLIEHVLIQIKKERSLANISLSVGNAVGSQGSLQYDCKVFGDSAETYKCTPDCQSKDMQRSGIIARRFVMSLPIPSIWISIYEIQVFSSPILVSDDISSYRHVLPSSCSSQTWLLTNNSFPANKAIATTTATSLYFEKPYVVTELVVQFVNEPPKTLDIVLLNAEGKAISQAITLSDCREQKFQFTCSINEKTFATTLLKVTTSGLVKLFVRGKPVFYPELRIKTSTNKKEKLQMTCEYSQCDLSVHSDCSPDTIKAGLKFDCANKRLIRVPSGVDKDTYVIVNRGSVETEWQKTKFTVDSLTDERMVVSMPRGYQYFGQYKCACIVADKMNTEITSEVTSLKESDFLEDIMFATSVQYKLKDDDSPFQSISNNVISVSKANLESAFIPIRLITHSLVPGNIVSIKYPSTEKDFETMSADRSVAQSLKAFNDIPKSWSVSTHKYTVDEIYAEVVHGKGLFIQCHSSTYKSIQKDYYRMFDEDQVKLKPVMWVSDSETKLMKLNAIYAGTDEATLFFTEKNCTSTNHSVLATFTDKKCVSSDLRLTCARSGESTLAIFTDTKNFAKTLSLSLKNNKTNTVIDELVVKGNIELNQDDAIVIPRYTKLVSKSSNPKINVVTVALNVISKKISDFIDCGGVKAEIMIDGLTKKDMILQRSTLSIDIEMTSPSINVTIIFSIDNVKGKYEAKIKITDPTTFSAQKVEFQDEKTLNLIWRGIDDVARDLLESYELTTEVSAIACDSVDVKTRSISGKETSGGKNRYQIPMSQASSSHLSNMTVTVYPVFIGGKRGLPVMVHRASGKIGQTTVSLDDVILPTERTITVMPSQSGLSCDIKHVEFSVSGNNVEKFQWKSKAMGNFQYKIMNLVPGRSYQLTARVIYKKGPNDTLSPLYTFETADDISVPITKHVAQINERVNISCTAEIGPEDKYRKVIEWLRADKSLLPDGVKSVRSANNPRVAFLIMEKALADYSGEYRCFAKPSAITGSVKITIAVNDLVVSRNEVKVDFNEQKSVSVTCSSTAYGKNDLVWIDPSGFVIPESGSSEYLIKTAETDQKLTTSTLTINKPSLAISGIYTCRKTIDTASTNMSFLLYGKEEIEIKELESSSKLVGEKLKLSCIGKPGLRNQKVVWDEVNNELSKTSYPDPKDKTNQTLEITNSLTIHRVKCSLVPALKDDSEIRHATHQIKLDSKLEVTGPTEAKEGLNVTLTCVGYPSDRDMHLVWRSYAKDSTKPVDHTSSKSMSKQKPYEPIKLVLNLTDVSVNNTGRYECNFNKDTRDSGNRLGKSMNLEIKPAAQVVPNAKPNTDLTKNPGGSAQASVASSVLMMLLTVLVSFSVYHRS